MSRFHLIAPSGYCINQQAALRGLARLTEAGHQVAQLLSGGDVRQVQLIDARILEIQKRQAAREQFAEDDPFGKPVQHAKADAA